MAIHLDASTTGWEKLILWSYRALALVWLFKGFYGWIGLSSFDEQGLASGDVSEQIRLAETVIFSILDIVASVSLWMSWRRGSGFWAVVALAFVVSEVTKSAPSSSYVLVSGAVILLLVHGARLVIFRATPSKRFTIV